MSKGAIESDFKKLMLISKEGRFSICRCHCGTVIRIRNDSLARGTKSCGCARIKAIIRVGKNNRIHGESHGASSTPEYRSYRAAIARCGNPKNNKYAIYGGVGVKVCDRWMKSYNNFLIDMGRKPSSKHSIDRYPDSNGDYEPSNCRWATALEQRHNRRGK